MDYTSLTIDTSILIGDGIYLESEIINRLKPITEGPKNIVISEIVLREMRRRLRHGFEEQRSRLKSQIKNSLNNGILGATQKETCEALLKSMADAETRAKEIVDGFVQDYKIETVGFQEVGLEGIVDDYFSGTAPFADRGDKKHEFPDAIALKSLESWAKTNNKFLLCVSEDSDWQRFCEGKHHIDCVGNLPDALDRMLENSEEIREKTAAFLNEDLDNLETRLMSDLQEHSIEVQGDSSYGDVLGKATIFGISFDDLKEDISENGILILQETIEIITIRINLNGMIVFTADLNFMDGNSRDPADIIGTEWIEDEFESEIPIEIKIKKQTGKLSEPELAVVGVSIPDSSVFFIGDRELEEDYF